MSNSNSHASSGKGFSRVSARQHCPACDSPDWCLIADDGTAAICPRTELGSEKRCGDAGWLHRLVERPTRPLTRKPTPKPFVPSRNWQTEAKRTSRALTAANREWLLDRLGLPPGALDVIPLLGLFGVNMVGPVTCWPETDAAGTIIGITDRTPGTNKDEKKMRAGGKRGLTLPTGWRERPGAAFVVEGPTDALAMTAGGLVAVGRPSKDGGAKLLARLFTDWPEDRKIVIVGENDPPWYVSTAGGFLFDCPGVWYRGG